MKDKMKRSLMSAAKSMASKGGSGEGPAGLEEKKTAVAVGAPPARAVPAAPPVPFGEGKAVDPAEKTGLTMSSFMGRAGGGGGGAGGQDPTQWLPKKDERLLALSNRELCMRLKNLAWGKAQLKALEEDVHTLWRTHSDASASAPVNAKDGASELGDLLVNSQMVVYHTESQLLHFLATKLVFFDLREAFVARLYYPTPAACPLAQLLDEGSELDVCLAALSEELRVDDAADVEQHVLWTLLEQVCAAVVQALEWCLIGEPMGAIQRELSPSDAQVVPRVFPGLFVIDMYVHTHTHTHAHTHTHSRPLCQVVPPVFAGLCAPCEEHRPPASPRVRTARKRRATAKVFVAFLS